MLLKILIFVLFGRYGFLIEELNGVEKKSYGIRGEKLLMVLLDY